MVEVAEGSVALFSPRSKLNLSKRMERTTEWWIRDFVKLSQVGERVSCSGCEPKTLQGWFIHGLRYPEQ